MILDIIVVHKTSHRLTLIYAETLHFKRVSVRSVLLKWLDHLNWLYLFLLNDFDYVYVRRLYFSRSRSVLLDISQHLATFYLKIYKLLCVVEL